MVEGTAPSDEAMQAAALLLARILVEHEMNRPLDADDDRAGVQKGSTLR